jgi:CHAT domain-containing protein
LEAKILALLGGVYRARGQFEDARNMLEASLDLFRRCGAREDQIRLLVTLSDLEIALGHKPAALEHARAAVALAGEAVVGVDPRWRAWLALGRAERANADMRGALVSCFRAFALVEAQNVALTADQLKVSVLSERQRVYSELADLYAAAGRVDEAFRVAEHGRARAMLDLLGISPGARDNVTPAQRERLEATSNHLSKLNHQMLSQSLPDGKRATVEAAVRDATQRREEMEMNIQSNQLKRFTRPADVAMVRNKVLAPGELLAEFILGDSSSLLWLITDHSARCIQLPPRRKIENETAAFLKLIASRPSALHLERDISRQMSSAAALFDMLFAGAAVELDSAQALIIIPDGVLHHLPFETLVRGGQYAIERIDISYAPSASVLGVLRDAVSGSDAPGRKALLAFGDPEAGRKMKPISRRPRRWQRVSDQLGAGGLARLPNAAAEITAVAKLFPEGQCSIHLGTEATEEAFRRASGERYSTLHFATHAMIDESFPARSGVLLAADGGSLEDGLLDISEIGSLHLNCDLVVLNACSTARGKLAPGEGMLGLTRAFLFAGASSVAVTLWDVSDLAASSVVTSFYRNIVAGRSTRAALRQAKIEMIRGRGLSRHPHYWGSLIVVGAAR